MTLTGGFDPSVSSMGGFGGAMGGAMGMPQGGMNPDQLHGQMAALGNPTLGGNTSYNPNMFPTGTGAGNYNFQHPQGNCNFQQQGGMGGGMPQEVVRIRQKVSPELRALLDRIDPSDRTFGAEFLRVSSFMLIAGFVGGGIGGAVLARTCRPEWGLGRKLGASLLGSFAAPFVSIGVYKFTKRERLGHIAEKFEKLTANVPNELALQFFNAARVQLHEEILLGPDRATNMAFQENLMRDVDMGGGAFGAMGGGMAAGVQMGMDAMGGFGHENMMSFDSNAPRTEFQEQAGMPSFGGPTFQ